MALAYPLVQASTAFTPVSGLGPHEAPLMAKKHRPIAQVFALFGVAAAATLIASLVLALTSSVAAERFHIGGSSSERRSSPQPPSRLRKKSRLRARFFGRLELS